MLAALLWIMAAAGCGEADGEPAAAAREMLEGLRERAENAASMSGRLEAELDVYKRQCQNYWDGMKRRRSIYLFWLYSTPDTKVSTRSRTEMDGQED